MFGVFHRRAAAQTASDHVVIRRSRAACNHHVSPASAFLEKARVLANITSCELEPVMLLNYAASP